MITFLRGKLVEKSPTNLVIDVNGVGFNVHIPLSTYVHVGEVGNSISILTYLHVREDSIQIFGFASQKERELFEKLITVQGVGPKMAQGVLSAVSVEDFKSSILREDYSILTSIPGIGRKTAQRLIVDLKEKLEAEVVYEEAPFESRSVAEAVLALVSLGYTKKSAKSAVQKVLKEDRAIASELPVEELIKRALKKL